MVSKKALAVIGALVMLSVGISLTNNNTAMHMQEKLVHSEVFNMPANETSYRLVTFNSSGTYRLIINVADGAIFSDLISETSFDEWVIGQFNVSWRGNENAHNIYDLPGFSRLYQKEVSDNATSNIEYVVFWNPETFSQEVTFRIYQLWTETDSFSYNIGLSLIVVSVITIIAVILLFFLKHKSQIREFNKALENQE
jgi:hypothetical protein